MPGGGQKDRIFDRLKAKLTGGTDDSGTSYFSMLEKKLSDKDADIIIKNMKTDIDGYPMFETGSTSGEDQRTYQEWIVERYLKTTFTEGFTDTTVAPVEEQKEEVAEEEAEEIVDEAEKEIKENLEPAVEVVNQAVEESAVVEEDKPNLDDIVDLLPPGMLDAVNQSMGTDYKKPEKEKKTAGVTNNRILKTLVQSLQKVQGKLESIDNELKKQNLMISDAMATTIGNLNSIETTYDGLNDKFDAILQAFEAQTAAKKKEIDDIQKAVDENTSELQEDSAFNEGLKKKKKKKDKDGGGPGLYDLYKLFRIVKFLRRGGLGKSLRRAANPTKTAKALARQKRMKFNKKLNKLPGGGKVSSGVQGSTNKLLSGKSSTPKPKPSITKPSITTPKPSVSKPPTPKPNALRSLAKNIKLPKITPKSIVSGVKGFGIGLGLEMAGEYLITQGLNAVFGTREEQLQKFKEGYDNATPEEREKGVAKMQEKYQKEVAYQQSPGHLIDKITKLGGQTISEQNLEVLEKQFEVIGVKPKSATESSLDKLGGIPEGYELDDNNKIVKKQGLEQGGLTTPGKAVLHGTEAIIPEDYESKLLAPIGGALIAASKGFLQETGPMAQSVAPMFSQVASKLTEEFDVPKSLARPNIGGQLKPVTNAINNIGGGDKEKESMSEGMDLNVAEKQDVKRESGPLGAIKRLWGNITSFFGGGPRHSDSYGVDGAGGDVGGDGKFIQGNSGTSGGIHYHIGPGSYQDGNITSSAGNADARAVAEKVIKHFQGKKSIYIGRLGYHVKESDDSATIKKKVQEGQEVHSHGGSQGGIDLQVGGASYPGAKVPFPLRTEGLKYRRGGFGVTAKVSGANAFVAHGLYDEHGNQAPQEDSVVYGEGGDTPSVPTNIVVGDRGKEKVMKNLVTSFRPISNMLDAYNASSTTDELISATKAYAPEILMYDEESEGMGSVLIINNASSSKTPPRPMPSGSKSAPPSVPKSHSFGKSLENIALF